MISIYEQKPIEIKYHRLSYPLYLILLYCIQATFVLKEICVSHTALICIRGVVQSFKCAIGECVGVGVQLGRCGCRSVGVCGCGCGCMWVGVCVSVWVYVCGCGCQCMGGQVCQCGCVCMCVYVCVYVCWYRCVCGHVCVCMGIGVCVGVFTFHVHSLTT